MSMSIDLLAKLNLGNVPVQLPVDKEEVNVVIPAIRDMFTDDEIAGINLSVVVSDQSNNYSNAHDVVWFNKSTGDVMLAVEIRGSNDRYSKFSSDTDTKQTNPDLVKATIVEALAFSRHSDDFCRERLTMFARIFGALIEEKYTVAQSSLDLGHRAAVKASFTNNGICVAITCILNSARAALLLPFPEKFGAIMRRWEHNSWEAADSNGGRLERVFEGKTSYLISLHDDRHRNTTPEQTEFRFQPGQVEEVIRSFTTPIYKEVGLVDWIVNYIDLWCKTKNAVIYAIKHEPYTHDTKKVSLELSAVDSEGKTFRINL